MLKGEPETHDLTVHREELFARCEKELTTSNETVGTDSLARLMTEAVRTFAYPVLTYPKKVTALNLDKTQTIEGTLLGVKGQYLIFDIGVLNVRKFTGYDVTVSF
jgi:hypothetical protein